MNSKAQYDEAERFITEKLHKELPAGLQYHNIQHIQDVLEAAVRIAKSENLGSKDIHLIRLAALFHDSGLIVSNKKHEEKGCELAKQILPSFGISDAELAIICSLILATRIPQSPKTLLENILCDADLDYLGREDFYEIGGKLREEMKQGGLIETEREWDLLQKAFLESHRYHTQFAQLNREGLKKKHLEEITSKLK